MEENHELQGLHSPRKIVQLTQELINDNHQFESDNPFSYYHEEASREVADSDEEDQAGSNKTGAIVEAKSQPTAQKSVPSQKEQIRSNEAKAQIIQKKPQIKVKVEAEKQLFKPPPPNTSSAEKKYQEEIDQDLADLKKKLSRKKIFEQPKTDKNKVNKTVGGFFSEDTEAQEMRMLIKMSFEKKKANYDMLKEWDKKRAEQLAIHGHVIQALQNQIDLRIKASLQNFQYYQAFFREKAKQQQKYTGSPVINTRYALQHNSLAKNVYINCTVILNSLCDENSTRCRKINDFITLIKNNILRDLTENHLASSQKQLLRIREKISTLKSSLKKYNQETEQKSVELANLFSDQSLRISQAGIDFYRTQLSFLRKAAKQIQVQKKLGEYCLEYFHAAVQEEVKRSQVIREAMLTYSKGLKQTYGLALESSSEIEQLSKHEEIRLIEQFYSLDEMFDSRTLQIIQKKTKQSEQLTPEVFDSYIQKFNYEIFDSRILLLKEFQVKSIKKEGEEACYLVITVDHFLHLTFNCKGGIEKPDITLKMSSKLLQIRSGKQEVVELIKKEERKGSVMSYFWGGNERSYRVRFQKRDNKEQFLDYMSKLMS